ncbi:MAG TPA: hypothetical protein VH157_11840 [Bryobacteraceae bacterium]|jgi:hypothetical protein|nr:hypothetical protein [Bryobacteraceae bacterium]
MTSDQARKLLGGYATNSLTEAERIALFEAALDDQELFDALQQEQALKELLADPESRNQVQQALVEKRASRGSEWSRWRVWGGLAGAVAAAVLIVAVIRSNTQPKYEVARVAPAQALQAPQSTPAIAAPAEPKQMQRAQPQRIIKETPPAAVTGSLNDLKASGAVSAPPPRPPATPVPAPAAAPRMQAFREELSVGAQTANVPLAGLAGQPVLRYSLLKRDAGDSVQLNVVSAVAGYLSLYQLDPAGNWKRLFPAADPGLPVDANASATVPESPIVVTDTPQKFRLTLVPAGREPVTLDVTIGPNKIP